MIDVRSLCCWQASSFRLIVGARQGSDVLDRREAGGSAGALLLALDGVGAVELGSVRRREGHIGQDVSLGLVKEAGEIRQLRPQLIGYLAPLCLGGQLHHHMGHDLPGKSATSAATRRPDQPAHPHKPNTRTRKCGRHPKTQV